MAQNSLARVTTITMFPVKVLYGIFINTCRNALDVGGFWTRPTSDAVNVLSVRWRASLSTFSDEELTLFGATAWHTVSDAGLMLSTTHCVCPGDELFHRSPRWISSQHSLNCRDTDRPTVIRSVASQFTPPVQQRSARVVVNVRRHTTQLGVCLSLIERVTNGTTAPRPPVASTAVCDPSLGRRPGHVARPTITDLSLIHIWRCRRIERCRSRWSPYH